jgi:hypothetical protein
VLGSGEDGSPPPLRDGEGKPVDWNKFGDHSWKYNVGREALAPNFSRYKNLPAETLKQVYAKYRASMDGTQMTEGEFKTLAKRADEEGYKPLDILYQAGNLEAERYETLRKAGIPDSKIMATDRDLRHGTGAKTDRRPESLFDEIYGLLQEPEMIYRAKKAKNGVQEIHFAKDAGDKKVLKIVLKARFSEAKNMWTALKISTMAVVDNHYGEDKVYEKIW